VHKDRTAVALVGFAVVALVAAGVVSYFASKKPDGLEYSLQGAKQEKATGAQAEAQGEQGAGYKGPMPDYATPGVKRRGLSGGIAGAAGIVITFGVLAGIGLVLRSRRGRKAKADG